MRMTTLESRSTAPPITLKEVEAVTANDLILDMWLLGDLQSYDPPAVIDPTLCPQAPELSPLIDEIVAYETRDMDHELTGLLAAAARPWRAVRRFSRLRVWQKLLVAVAVVCLVFCQQSAAMTTVMADTPQAVPTFQIPSPGSSASGGHDRVTPVTDQIQTTLPPNVQQPVGPGLVKPALIAGGQQVNAAAPVRQTVPVVNANHAPAPVKAEAPAGNANPAPAAIPTPNAAPNPAISPNPVQATVPVRPGPQDGAVQAPPVNNPPAAKPVDNTPPPAAQPPAPKPPAVNKPPVLNQPPAKAPIVQKPAPVDNTPSLGTQPPKASDHSYGEQGTGGATPKVGEPNTGGPNLDNAAKNVVND
jgi:hypothetical protein